MSADAIMGAAAVAAIPGLSRAEQALDGEQAAPALFDQATREFTEDWLYFHLDCARRARAAMDRLTEWGIEYQHHYLARQQALEAAAIHYRRLLRHGFGIPELLARMALAEELTP